MKIKQFGAKEGFDENFKYKVKDLNGVSISRENGLYDWQIDEKIFSLDELKNKLQKNYKKEVEEFERRFREEKIQVKKLNFENLSKSIQEKNIFNSLQRYTVIGDVNDCKICNDYSYFDLVFDNDSFKRLKVYVEDKYISESDKNTLKNMSAKNQVEAQVTGTIRYDSKHIQFRIIPDEEIKILGKSKRLKQIEEWDNKREEMHLKKQITPRFNSTLIKIGLITKKDSKGYKDFYAQLNKKNVDSNKYIDECNLKDVKFKSEEIITAIKNLNKQKSCDMIFIVAAGGDPYYLLAFSDIELLQTICESEIPIFTGIAHTDDLILCDEVSANPYKEQNIISPTAAADYFVGIIKGIEKQEKQLKEKNQKKECIDNKGQEISKFEQIIKEKDSEIERLKKIIEEKNQEITNLKNSNQVEPPKPNHGWKFWK